MRKYAQSLKRSLQSLVQIYLRYDFFIFHWEYLKCHKDVKKPTQSWCLHFCLCHVTAPNLCWLISALCSLCVFVHCLFCPRIMGFAHFSVDLMLHNSVRSFKFAPYAEMHRRTRTSLSCSFRDQHFCFHVMYERESCLLLEILFFFFPRRCDWVNFNGALFFCVAWKTKKPLFSNWHAAVYQWLPQRRTVQGHVFMRSLASKTSSPSMSLPLIWCGLLVISSMESNHTELLYWYWSLLSSFFKDYACEEFTLDLFRKQRALSIPCRLSNS